MRIAILAVLVACGSSPTTESFDFYGIQYQAPPGTTAGITRSVLPGPEGLGGSPVDERPYVTITLAGRFSVQITKTQGPSTLEGTKALYIANRIGTNHTGVTTPTGWELTYRTARSDDATKTSSVHLMYADLGGGHYECIYGEQNCPDIAAAEAICRSMRAKR